jgi:hypothetical protein
MKKQDDSEDTKQTESLIDLQVTDEQAEETRAGASPKLFQVCATGKHITE